MSKAQTIGVISDTHGLLRPQAVQALQGVDMILHAGDVGKPEVLANLEKLAPVYAIRGNVDRELWAQSLPYTRVVETAGGLVYILHDVFELELDPAAAGFAAIISGHSHQSLIQRRGDVLYLNPGSAGPRRFTLPVSLALLTVKDGWLEPELIELKV